MRSHVKRHRDSRLHRLDRPSALAVVDAHADRLEVVGLAAGENAAALGRAGRALPAARSSRSPASDGRRLRARRGRQVPRPRCVGRPHGSIAVATHPDVDIVLCASSGTAALEAVLAAIEAGKTIALANKEVLVMAGEHGDATRPGERGVADPAGGQRAQRDSPVPARPAAGEVERLILTASGGPFRDMAAAATGSA